MEAKRVVMLTNILPPYRIPLFNALNRCGQFSLKIAFLAEREANRRWRVRSNELTVKQVTLPGWSHYLWHIEVPLHVNWGVYRFLKREAPDVIIVGGYSHPANWQALLYSRLHCCRLILWSGTTASSVRIRTGPIQTARRAFVHASHAFVTYGVRAAEFLKSLGAKPESIFIGTNVGDVNFFREAVRRYRETPDYKRRRAEVSGPVILSVGQFIPRKGIAQLLQALWEVRDREWKAFIVGDGPLRAALESLCSRLGLAERVRFVPFQEREDLVAFYGIADIFILPSLLEVGAIVVSEALASGVFVVASGGDGVAPDLIQLGRTGLIFDPSNPRTFSTAIGEALQIVSSKDARNEIATSMDSYTPEHYAEAFCRAIEYVLEDSKVQRKSPDAVGIYR